VSCHISQSCLSRQGWRQRAAGKVRLGQGQTVSVQLRSPYLAVTCSWRVPGMFHWRQSLSTCQSLASLVMSAGWSILVTAVWGRRAAGDAAARCRCCSQFWMGRIADFNKPVGLMTWCLEANSCPYLVSYCVYPRWRLSSESFILHAQWRIQGVQGVQTPALLFRCHFLKIAYFENTLLRFLAEQGASWRQSRNYRNLVRDLT